MKINHLLSLKMTIKESQKIPETAIYIIIWLLIFILPMLVVTSNRGKFDNQVFVDMLRMIPFLIIFIINTVWLLPKFLLKGKTLLYFISVVVISLLLVYLWDFIFPIISGFINGNQSENAFDPGLFREGKQHLSPGQRPLPQGQILPGPDRQGPFPRIKFLNILNQMVISWLVVGFNDAIKLTNKWFKNNQDKRELEKEHLKSKLESLQNKISPHFFMNTLNNIHAQIDINTKDAQASILTLSKMMRYLLYELDKGPTTIKKEVEFLESYVDLMRLRVDDSVDINLNISIENLNNKIQPFLFISFVENAFKHGISYNEKSYIKIDLKQKLKFIEFKCINFLSVKNEIKNEYSGEGLDNIKKRLRLLYKNNYELDISEQDKEFKVYLKIPIDEN